MRWRRFRSTARRVAGYPGYLDAPDENSRLPFIPFDIASLIKRMDKVLLPN